LIQPKLGWCGYCEVLPQPGIKLAISSLNGSGTLVCENPISFLNRFFRDSSSPNSSRTTPCFASVSMHPPVFLPLQYCLVAPLTSAAGDFDSISPMVSTSFMSGCADPLSGFEGPFVGSEEHAPLHCRAAPRAPHWLSASSSLSSGPTKSLCPFSFACTRAFSLSGLGCVARLDWRVLTEQR
jgi:hypothetical protein